MCNVVTRIRGLGKLSSPVCCGREVCQLLYGIMAYDSLQYYNYFDFNSAFQLADDPSSQLLTVAQSRPFFYFCFLYFRASGVIHGHDLSLNTGTERAAGNDSLRRVS